MLVLLDACRADRLSSYGYARPTTPSIDALAREGVLFEEHYAQTTTTRSSLPSMLFSRYFIPPLFPASDRVMLKAPGDLFRTIDPAAVSLPRTLSRAGLRTAMISAHTWLREGTGFAARFDEAYDLSSRLDFDASRGYPRAKAVIDFALGWMQAHASDGFFLYLHLMDTHFPHYADEDALREMGPELAAHPPLERFTRAGGVRDASRPLDAREKAYLDALYDGDLSYVDRQLGRLFSWMRSRPEGRLLIVTADHGEGLMEAPGRFSHGLPPYEQVAHIPLVVWSPSSLRPARVGQTTEAVDLEPTILSLLGVAPPAGASFDGRDLTPLARGEALPPRPAVMLGGIRSGKYKLILRSEAEAYLSGGSATGAKAPELFDLDTDPLETHDLAAQSPEIVSRLLGLLRDRLTAPHARYLSSTTHEPPDVPFAISSRHLALEPARPCTGDTAHLEKFFGSGEGWMRFCDPQGDFLVAEEGAPPMKLGVHLPDGRYRVRLGLSGRVSVSVGGGDEREAAGGTFNPWDYFPWPVTVVDAGVAVVKGETLEIRMRPDAGTGPAALEYVGFSPIHGTTEGEKEDPARLERLRSLGYVDE